jgi:ABC-type multidrug transport system fused ATPase/permease subunit
VGSVGCFARIQSFLQSDPRVDARQIVQDGNGSASSAPPSEHSQSALDKGYLAAHDGESRRHSVTGQQLKNAQLGADAKAVAVRDGAFGYDAAKAPTLAGMDLEVPMGRFTMLVGPVGSGKSTLLRAFLGELSIVAGSIHVSSSEIAYCDQTPWHMNGTVRDSIIAFSPTDERWYQQVLEACALKQDLAQLPKGDLTSIGSKGIVLSGGQSQRIVSSIRAPSLLTGQLGPTADCEIIIEHCQSRLRAKGHYHLGRRLQWPRRPH